MRQTKLYILTIGLLLGALLLTACSSDALPGDDSGIKEVSRTDSCYINLRIVNTSQARTRTREVEAATSEENAIYDGILCIFEGASESAATLKSAVAIDQLLNNRTNGSGVGNNGTSVNVIQQLPLSTYSYTNNLYALVLLNTTETGFSLSGNMLYFNGATQSGKTRSQIQQLQIKGIGSTDTHVGLFMSNAPTAADGTALVQITNLYDTDAAARSGTAHTITVERAAAKISVTSNYSSGDNIDNITLNGTTTKAHYHTMTWAVNQYNTTCYALRNPGGSDLAWAQDINYTAAPQKITTDIDFSLYPLQSHSSDVVYVAENTTSTPTKTANQTCVIVEVQVKDASNMLIHEALKFDYASTLFTSTDQFIKYLKDGWDGQKGGYEPISSKTKDEVYKYPTITINDDGTVNVTLVNESFTSEEKTELNRLASNLSGWLHGFRDGKMYYTYYIYNDATNYGIVRNNVYNLKLSSISGIGRPTP